MTITEIATYTTAKLGINDATTLALAKSYARARWAMLWNAASWRQSRMQENISVTAGTQDVTLNGNLEFATAARWAGNTELQAMHDLNALAVNPSGYDQTGTVAAFAQLPKDSSGNAVLRLFAIPASAQTLLVIGKAKVPALGDADSPTLIGADECLCAFTMGDLYQWQRQLAKAQVFFQEGTALLAKMQEIETGQAADNRRIIPTEQVLDDDQGGKWW